MKNNDRGCSEVSVEELLLFAYGEDVDSRIKEHVEGCEACRSYLAMLKEVRGVAAEAGFAHAPDEVVAVVKAKAGELKPAGPERGAMGWRRFFGWFNVSSETGIGRPWASALLAAALAAAIGIAIYWSAFKGPDEGGMARRGSEAPTYLSGISEDLQELEALFGESAETVWPESDAAEDESLDIEDEFSLDSGRWELVMEEEAGGGISDLEVAMLDLEYDLGLVEEEESEAGGELFESDGYGTYETNGADSGGEDYLPLWPEIQPGVTF